MKASGPCRSAPEPLGVSARQERVLKVDGVAGGMPADVGVERFAYGVPARCVHVRHSGAARELRQAQISHRSPASHIYRVSAELHRTQSTLSRQIAGLERQLGVPLLERHPRGTRPTPAGEVFRHHAPATLPEADRALRAVRAAREGSYDRPLTVGATPSLAAGIVPEAVRALLRQAGPLRWSLLPRSERAVAPSRGHR